MYYNFGLLVYIAHSLNFGQSILISSGQSYPNVTIYLIFYLLNITGIVSKLGKAIFFNFKHLLSTLSFLKLSTLISFG